MFGNFAVMPDVSDARNGLRNRKAFPDLMYSPRARRLFLAGNRGSQEKSEKGNFAQRNRKSSRPEPVGFLFLQSFNSSAKICARIKLFSRILKHIISID